MKLTTLYGKSSGGALLLWECFTEDNIITVRHGQVGGKIQEKTTTCKGKNIGKANETSDSGQADLEATAKWTKQKKKLYFETKDEALESVEFSPMKLVGWKDQAHKITYPCYISPKLDGQRYLTQSDGSGLSKQGESISLPEHIQSDVNTVRAALGNRFKGLDGEIYAGLVEEGGLSLQRIISAFRKPNEDTHKLQYWLYDIPDSTEPYNQRLESLREIGGIVKAKKLKNIVVLRSAFVASKDAVLEMFNLDIKMGFEGSVVRNKKGMYEFGKRSHDAQKIKSRQTTEARVLSVKKDKNGQGLVSCELENGVTFDCLMLKNASLDTNLRLYDNALTLIGTWIEVEFESYSDSGVPLKPVGIRTRNVNPTTFEGE